MKKESVDLLAAVVICLIWWAMTYWLVNLT
jgi:hypothetical protein